MEDKVSRQVSFVNWVVYAVFVYFRDRRGWLTGEWRQFIPEVGDRPKREDKIICLHQKKSQRVTAKIIRVKPEEKKPKQWTFSGALREDGSLVGYFLGLEANSDSYGVIFMRKEDRNKFSGHYFKLLNLSEVNKKLLSSVPLAEILGRERIPLEWTRTIRSRGFCDFITSKLTVWRIVGHPQKSEEATSPEKADRV